MLLLQKRENITISYAASELKKYLSLVSAGAIKATISTSDTSNEKPTITLGLLEDLHLDTSDLFDATIEDIVDVNIQNGTGYIAGSNARSVLFGVYDYLKSMGCRWVRPGPLGEYIAQCDPLSHTFTMRKKADLPFRGECFEGAVKYEHLRAAVEWAPKVHMNLFMIQGIVPYNFMSRWYQHAVNTVRPSEDIGYDGVAGLVAALEQDIARCGLQFHAMGHCYQTEPYGMHYITSFDKYDPPKKLVDALALVNGKRAFRGSPSWTQICMGNDQVLLDEVNWIADYAQRKPYIDFLHVWLGDGVNNHCECELCLPHHPSDLYVKMLNLLDAELTKRNLKTKIVFISYTDTLWAPRKERIQNPSRFILTTAIAGRNYGEPYDDRETTEEIPVWERNKFPDIASFPLRRKMMNEWKSQFDGPNFAFEYHFYVEHYNDPGYMECAENFYRDLHQLKVLGIQGMMNCQTQRAAFPTAFPIFLTGEALFDQSVEYSAWKEDYFAGAFGENGSLAAEYLEEITKRFNPKSLRKIVRIEDESITSQVDDRENIYWQEDPLAPARFAAIPAFIDSFLPTIQKGAESENPCHARSWKLLEYHADYCKRLSEIYRLGALGDMDAAKNVYKEMIDVYSKLEQEIEYEFDLFLFDRHMAPKLS